ncbi:MAG: class I SAM-dependent methyltransferase [Candidatus Kapabacteria bacterium]|jgi:2-polyprenyl-3-methyl-5-hydroxy-6-metoxy-1,4-benzoquinol methylase|nr:class I SAM-dependent methyltransferase [Candidatus Kapabacteria bacterium]
MSNHDHRSHLYARYTDVQTRTGIHELAAKVRLNNIELFRQIGHYLPSNRHSRILDLGCGYGGFLLLLQERGYVNTSGVDISPQQVAAADQLGVKNVVEGTIEQALGAEQTYDLISMFDVIEHLTRSEAIATLTLIHERLSPNGTLIIRTPNVDSRLGTVLSFGDLTHEMHLNLLSAKELFASLPYTTVHIEPSWPTGGSVLHRILRPVARAILRVITTVEALAVGIPRSMLLPTPNMFIVATKQPRE